MENCTLAGFDLVFMISGILFIYLVGLITGYEMFQHQEKKLESLNQQRKYLRSEIQKAHEDLAEIKESSNKYATQILSQLNYGTNVTDDGK